MIDLTKWEYFKAGGLVQVDLATSKNICQLHQLDLKDWVALACPVKGLHLDKKTLELLDSDHDGRIRPPEIIAAVAWACERLNKPSMLARSTGQLLISDLNNNTDAGKRLITSTQLALDNLQKKHTDSIKVEDISNSIALFTNTRINGDGIITVHSTDDDQLKQTITDIGKIFGTVVDRAGVNGIDKARITDFFAAAKDLLAWTASETTALILGNATPHAYEILTALEPCINDFFERCQLAAYDNRAINALHAAEETLFTTIAKESNLDDTALAKLPLQTITPTCLLDLSGPWNPVWKKQIEEFISIAIKPLLDAEQKNLNPEQWEKIKSLFIPYEKWLSAKTGAVIEPLGIERINAIINSGHESALDQLLAQDLTIKEVVDQFVDVERLTRYIRDLPILLRNFVNFADFYGKEATPIFQAGTLYLDERACSLCIFVEDINAHLLIATQAKLFIAYCGLSRKNGEKSFIAACFTRGDNEFLTIGRNGVFYDRNGVDWDATITKVVENPLSIRQAFWHPYKKAVRFMDELTAKRAAAANESAFAKIEKSVVDLGKPTLTPTPPATSPPGKIRWEIGTIAALGVGVGAIGTMVGGAVSGFLELGWWMPLGILGLLVLISGPSMLIAWLKLRQRTLGPLLEGAGWAINGRVKINFPLANYLTDEKELPPRNHCRNLDPYIDHKARRRRIFFFVLLASIASVLIYFQFPYVKAWLLNLVHSVI